MTKPARKLDADTRDLTERMWRGTLRWADRAIRPRFIALVGEFLARVPPPEKDAAELTEQDVERVEASLARLVKCQAMKWSG